MCQHPKRPTAAIFMAQCCHGCAACDPLFGRLRDGPHDNDNFWVVLKTGCQAASPRHVLMMLQLLCVTASHAPVIMSIFNEFGKISNDNLNLANTVSIPSSKSHEVSVHRWLRNDLPDWAGVLKYHGLHGTSVISLVHTGLTRAGSTPSPSFSVVPRVFLNHS